MVTSVTRSEVLTHVTIPVPLNRARARGRHSTGSLNPFQMRFSVDDMELIEQEAERLGVGKAQFIRWCAVYVAKALRDDRGEGDVTHVDP